MTPAVEGSQPQAEAAADAGTPDKPFSVRTGVLDEKCAALHALGVYVEYAAPAFVPFLPWALQSTRAAIDNPHEDIRVQVGRLPRGWWRLAVAVAVVLVITAAARAM